MAEEPDNLVLQHLRAIRAILDQFGERLERVEKKQDEMNRLLTYSVGEATTAIVKTDTLGARVARLDHKVDELTARIDAMTTEPHAP